MNDVWVIEWDDEWMNEWMNEWTNEWMNGSNEWIKWMLGHSVDMHTHTNYTGGYGIQLRHSTAWQQGQARSTTVANLNEAKAIHNACRRWKTNETSLENGTRQATTIRQPSVTWKYWSSTLPFLLFQVFRCLVKQSSISPNKWGWKGDKKQRRWREKPRLLTTRLATIDRMQCGHIEPLNDRLSKHGFDPITQNTTKSKNKGTIIAQVSSISDGHIHLQQCLGTRS
jgi:hypothetical protein